MEEAGQLGLQRCSSMWLLAALNLIFFLLFWMTFTVIIYQNDRRPYISVAMIWKRNNSVNANTGSPKPISSPIILRR